MLSSLRDRSKQLTRLTSRVFSHQSSSKQNSPSFGGEACVFRLVATAQEPYPGRANRSGVSIPLEEACCCLFLRGQRTCLHPRKIPSLMLESKLHFSSRSTSFHFSRRATERPWNSRILNRARELEARLRRGLDELRLQNILSSIRVS